MCGCPVLLDFLEKNYEDHMPIFSGAALEAVLSILPWKSIGTVIKNQ